MCTIDTDQYVSIQCVSVYRYIHIGVYRYTSVSELICTDMYRYSPNRYILVSIDSRRWVSTQTDMYVLIYTELIHIGQYRYTSVSILIHIGIDTNRYVCIDTHRYVSILIRTHRYTPICIDKEQQQQQQQNIHRIETRSFSTNNNTILEDR